MYKQGLSLGRQLSRWTPAINAIVIADEKRRVWFMGRDCDVLHGAYAHVPNVGYITGLNRDNARKLHHRRKLMGWLKSIGVRPGDVLIDSGYSGSIYDRIADSGFCDLGFMLLTSEGKYPLVDPALNGETERAIILALEHSPKREVVFWDADKRTPHTRKTGGGWGIRTATQFYDGCVAGIREGGVIGMK